MFNSQNDRPLIVEKTRIRYKTKTKNCKLAMIPVIEIIDRIADKIAVTLMLHPL